MRSLGERAHGARREASVGDACRFSFFTLSCRISQSEPESTTSFLPGKLSVRTVTERRGAAQRRVGGRSLRNPDSGRCLCRERGQDDVFDAETPELTDDDGGVGHTATRFDAGNEDDGPGCSRDAGEGAPCHGQSEGPRGYALALTDAGQVGEDSGAMDVFFVHGRSEGVDVADGDG